MQIKQSVTINGREVLKLAEFNGLSVWREAQDTGDETLYFVDMKKGQVVQKMDITADYSQCCGYIDSIEFSLP